MACFRPLKGYAGDGGLSFVRVEGVPPIPIPCGSCIGCRLRRARDWSIRCLHEASLHEENCFVTLTYDDAHLPERSSLNVRDWQLFAKRVRKALGAFRFLQCGEYGPRSNRPHHHALLFGVDFHDTELLYEKDGYRMFRSPVLSALWGLGANCSVGALVPETAAYVAGYALKADYGRRRYEQYERVDTVTGEVYSVRPEFITMSRNPGIGARWYDKFKGDLFPDDSCVFKGREVPVPTYYWRRLEVEDPSSFSTLKAVREAERLQRDDGAAPLDRWRAKHDDKFTRLAVRERVALAKVFLGERSL